MLFRSQRRELRGTSASTGQDPIDDYAGEAERMLKIVRDNRLVAEKLAAEKAAAERKQAEDARQKAGTGAKP
mgnify:CR=1 FL=1